ncbi:hypothetical protein LC612_36135 [Nostoc sp. CHAB 5834]|nr:hypothetical protein [Nostoc sp. CHAB 5834]
MEIEIKFCGTNSVIGAIYEKLFVKGIFPDEVTVNIETVMQCTDVEKEVQKARDVFVAYPTKLKLGTVGRDLYKEQLMREPKDTLCFS